MNKKQPVVTGNAEVANAFVTECISKRPIDFNQKWVNESDGYFDRAIKGSDAPVLELGVQYHCTDIEGRNIMLIGTELGNVVVFQRTAKNPNVIVAQASPVMNVFINEILGEISVIDSIEHLDTLIDIQSVFASAPEERRAALLALHSPVIVDKTETKMNQNPEQNKPEAKADQAAQADGNTGEAKAESKAEAKAEAKEAPKAAEQTQSSTKEKDMKQAAKETKAEINQDLTGWGVVWRVTGLAILCVAIVAAVVLGVYYGGAYLAGLGLSQWTMYAINFLVAFVSGSIVVQTVIKSVHWIMDIIARKAPASPSAPAAAAAA